MTTELKDNNQGDRFQNFANIVLGGLSGILISTPLSMLSSNPTTGTVCSILGLFLGLLIGYRRKNSRAFMYLCFIVIIVLVGILFSATKI